MADNRMAVFERMRKAMPDGDVHFLRERSGCASGRSWMPTMLASLGSPRRALAVAR